MKSLKELREYNNLKSKEVAQHIGVSDRVYSYYEKGRTLPAKYVKPLANLFGISCDEFLENTENTLYWEKEFGCIERTERLELPTWEEFSKLKSNHIRFISKKGANCKIEGYCDAGSGFIDVVSGGHSMLMVSDYSKEIYIKACRKAKELFLGEKK